MKESKNLKYLTDMSEENMHELWNNVFEGRENYEYINKYVPYPVKDIATLNYYLNIQNGYKAWLIQRKAEVDIIGFVIHGDFYPGENNNIGLNIGLKYAGKGYGTEVLGALNEYLKDAGYEETFGLCFEGNMGIKRVMEKNGYVNIGKTGDVKRGQNVVKYRREF